MYIPPVLQGSPLPGACVCYIVSKDDGKPAIYTRAYGISRRVGAENIPVRSDTVFPIGPSFFKNMLMIVIMQLVREKRVNLDDNVQDILKEVQFRVSVELDIQYEIMSSLGHLLILTYDDFLIGSGFNPAATMSSSFSH